MLCYDGLATLVHSIVELATTLLDRKRTKNYILLIVKYTVTEYFV